MCLRFLGVQACPSLTAADPGSRSNSANVGKAWCPDLQALFRVPRWLSALLLYWADGFGSVLLLCESWRFWGDKRGFWGDERGFWIHGRRLEAIIAVLFIFLSISESTLSRPSAVLDTTASLFSITSSSFSSVQQHRSVHSQRPPYSKRCICCPLVLFCFHPPRLWKCACLDRGSLCKATYYHGACVWIKERKQKYLIECLGKEYFGGECLGRVCFDRVCMEESALEGSSSDLVCGRECAEECVVLHKTSPSHVPVFRCLVWVLMTLWRYLCVSLLLGEKNIAHLGPFNEQWPLSNNLLLVGIAIQSGRSPDT